MKTLSLLGLVCCLVSGPVAADGRQTKEGPVYDPGNGVSAPVLIKEVKPQYTAEAMRARAEGTVALECVVQPDGTTGEVHVTKALHPDLDEEAIKAVKQWRFKPGLRDGKPVAVRITLEMSFSLRDKRSGALFPVPPVSPRDAGGTDRKDAPAVHRPGAGVSAPVAVKQVKPRYTAEARRAGIQGTVEVECVVEPDGRVGEVKVTRSLDEGLDQEAIKAVRQWRFEPGTKDRKPVPVLISLEMTFTLR